MRRIVFIDIAKAICIMLVVVGHYVPDGSPGWYVAVHDVIYTFHMPLFMFASGYVYMATRKDVPYGGFLLKKARRLMVPYLATSAIVITIKLLSQGGLSVDNPVTPLSYLKMLYRPEAGAFLWFIWALWWMFVVVPLLRTKAARLAFFFAALALHYVPLPLPDVFCLAQCKSMLVYFMLGVVVCEHRALRGFAAGLRPARAAAAAAVFAAAQACWLAFGGGKSTLIVWQALPYIGIWFVLEVSKAIARCSKGVETGWLMAVSASSYIIYLFHTTFEGFAKAVFRKLPLDPGLWYVFVAEAAVAVAIGIVAPVLLHRLLMRHRATRLLFGL